MDSRHYKVFYGAIKAKYPQIITIADERMSDMSVEIVDDHFYVDPARFFSMANHYDNADRRAVKDQTMITPGGSGKPFGLAAVTWTDIEYHGNLREVLMKTTVYPCSIVTLGAIVLASAVGWSGSQTQNVTFGAPAQPTALPVDPNAAAYVLKLGSRGIRVHDPSAIVRCKDEYWIFCTGRGTPSYCSKDLMTWERGPQTFKKSPEWVAQAVPGNRGGLDFWAPDIVRFRDKYLLYFSVSTFGKNTSAIGLATNVTLDPCDPSYEWKDGGIVIQSNPRDDFNAIDPAVTQDADGNLWMSFGSFWGGIKLIQLDPATGKRIAPNSPIHALAHYDSIEAPFIYYRNGAYYLFLNWGMCCRGVNSTYNMRVGRSPKITGPYLDKEDKDMLEGGGTLLLDTDGPFIGPGHAGILKQGDKYWLGMHFYDGSTRWGASMYALRPLTWTDDGWPVVGVGESVR